MLIKEVTTCQRFEASDRTHLCELLHPNNDKVGLPFSISHAFLNPNESSLPHQLSIPETYYFLSGMGEMSVGNERIQVNGGQLVHVPANITQLVDNTGASKLQFLCIVSPPYTPQHDKNI